MSELTWMSHLQQQVIDAKARVVSLFAKLEEGRRQTAAHVDRQQMQLGRTSDARDRAPEPDRHARILQLFRGREFARLSVKEQRYAAKQFSEVAAADMQQFLSAYPANWKAFATECFRRWDAFEHVSERSAYTRLLCLAPSSIAFLHSVLRPQELVAAEGPPQLARSINAGDLREAGELLRERGFDPTWSYSANVLACWSLLRSQHPDPDAFARTWDALAGDRTLEAMLLPPLQGTAASWFSTEHRPARIRRSLDAYATFVGALIRTAYTCGVEPAHWSAFTDGLLRSTFGDPRIPPESKGWLRLKQADQGAYERFLEQLITEDLTVFFDHAMQDRRRKKFWLRYLKSVRRTVCVLDRPTHSLLKKQLEGADKKLSAAISRARKFTTKSAGVQAFCLYFDSVVVVEFSATGNAAYVYNREVFEKEFARDIYTDQCPNPGVLKAGSLARGRILHKGDYWEERAGDALSELWIHPDR